MKPFYFLTLLLFSHIVMKAQNYIPFPTSDAYWTEEYDYMSMTVPNDTFVNYLNGDTVINGTTYGKVYSYNHIVSLQGFIREQNKMVYARYPGDTSDHVLYDFNVLPGDTVSFYFSITIGPSLYIVTSIDSEMTVTGQRKAINLFTVFSGNSPFGEARWVEGIGDIYNGLLYSQIFPVDDYRNMLCFTDSGIPTWYSNVSSCQTVGVADNVLKNEISVFPNPSSDFIKFTSGVTVDVQLYNSLGQRVSSHESITELTLNRTDYKDKFLIAEVVSVKEKLYIKLIFN